MNATQALVGAVERIWDAREQERSLRARYGAIYLQLVRAMHADPQRANDLQVFVDNTSPSRLDALLANLQSGRSTRADVDALIAQIRRTIPDAIATAIEVAPENSSSH